MAKKLGRGQVFAKDGKTFVWTKTGAVVLIDPTNELIPGKLARLYDLDGYTIVTGQELVALIEEHPELKKFLELDN